MLVKQSKTHRSLFRMEVEFSSIYSEICQLYSDIIFQELTFPVIGHYPLVNYHNYGK